MNREQLNHWLHAKHIDHTDEPKIYVISCGDAGCYVLAVEYKHHLEPIRLKEEQEPVHYQSLDQVKEELHRLGVHNAWLRLHNADDEFGGSTHTSYNDIRLAVH